MSRTDAAEEKVPRSEDEKRRAKMMTYDPIPQRKQQRIIRKKEVEARGVEPLS